MTRTELLRRANTRHGITWIDLRSFLADHPRQDLASLGLVKNPDQSGIFHSWAILPDVMRNKVAAELIRFVQRLMNSSVLGNRTLSARWAIRPDLYQDQIGRPNALGIYGDGQPLLRLTQDISTGEWSWAPLITHKFIWDGDEYHGIPLEPEHQESVSHLIRKEFTRFFGDPDQQMGKQVEDQVLRDFLTHITD